MLGLSPRAASYTWTAAFVLLLLYIAYLIRGTLFILVVSILFAYLLYPLVDYLNGHLPSPVVVRRSFTTAFNGPSRIFGRLDCSPRPAAPMLP